MAYMFLCTEQVPTGLLACIRVGGHWKVCCLLPRGRGRALGVAEQGPVRAPSDSILPQAWVGCGGGLGGRLRGRLPTLPECILRLQRNWPQVWPGGGSPQSFHRGPLLLLDQHIQAWRPWGRWLLPHPVLASPSCCDLWHQPLFCPLLNP